MNIKYQFYILFISLFIISSCNKKDPISSKDYFQDFIYPISIGNMWIYEGYYNNEMYNIDLSEYNVSINFIDTITVDSLYSEEDKIYRFKSIYVENDQVLEPGFTYISNDNEGLIHHGFESINSHTSLPRLNENITKYKINGQLFSFDELLRLIDVNSEINWDGPLLSIKYPLNYKSQWTYRVSDPFRMDKLITEIDDKQFIIQTLYDMDNDLSWDDNINLTQTYSKNGLISYNLKMDSVEVYNVNGDSIGYGSFITNVNLVELIIK